MRKAFLNLSETRFDCAWSQEETFLLLKYPKNVKLFDEVTKTVFWRVQMLSAKLVRFSLLIMEIQLYAQFTYNILISFGHFRCNLLTL